jgi:DNA-binding response OmpR family regulator
MSTYARSKSRAQSSRSGAAKRKNEAGGPAEQAASAHDVSTGIPEPSAPRVAILDGDSGFLVVLGKRMERHGWKHRRLSSRISAKALTELDVDALILDLELLGQQRWKVLGRLCRERPEIAVVICTGSSTVAQRVCGLRLGADDWLTKPCHPEELIARVEAVTLHRRRPEPRNLEPVALGEVEVRPDQYQAFVGGNSLQLTRREYQLIELLSRAGGEVLTRESVYECLWGGEMLRNDRSVDVFVHKLRRKLELASPQWSYIHTHFGVGYRLAAERVESASISELPTVASSEADVERLAA